MEEVKIVNKTVKIVARDTKGATKYDRLILTDNIYVNEDFDVSKIDPNYFVELNIISIEYLVINNINNYYIESFELLITKIVNNGILYLNNVILNNLNTERFSKTIINNCVIYDLIGECQTLLGVENDLNKTEKPRNIIGNNYKLSRSNYDRREIYIENCKDVMIHNNNNSLITKISSNGNDINSLTILNVLLDDDIELDIGIIDELTITYEIDNIHHNNIFEKLISKVKNNGKIYLTNVMMLNLDCSRFSRAIINNSFILNNIVGDCKVINNNNIFHVTYNENVIIKIENNNHNYNHKLSCILAGEYSYSGFCIYENDKYLMFGNGTSKNNNDKFFHNFYNEPLINMIEGFFIRNVNNYCKITFSDNMIMENDNNIELRKKNNYYNFTKIYYPNGDVYEGIVYGIKRYEYGIMTYANGDVYEGSWVNDRRSGKGTLIFANNDEYTKYVGKWRNDKMHGHGALTYRVFNYKKYIGKWRNDKRNGKGREVIYHKRNKTIYDEKWSYDKLLYRNKRESYCD